MSNWKRTVPILVALTGLVGVIVVRYINRPVPAELFVGLGVVLGIILIAGIALIALTLPSRMTLRSMPELPTPAVLLSVNTDASVDDIMERWKTESNQVGDRVGSYSVVSVEKRGVGIWIGGKTPRQIVFVPAERVRAVGWALEPFRNVPAAPVVTIEIADGGGVLRFLVAPPIPLRNIRPVEADRVTETISEVLDVKRVSR
ncbi:hypothetical protein [Herbiconiux ginsengi]|uniref:Uncharacterized protein n=1 Tax=Herbiconiux ginsengi TaxID=381665 RepID=A0A1H3KPW7_9MICO|nr:hypothetical protein [Herbiconiux ginsengi]SDY54069.1 hypothetical protein SAMN05216554_0644 [Herbiconiux ginsengi]